MISTALRSDTQQDLYTLHVCSECTRNVETFGDRHDHEKWDTDSEMCVPCAEREFRSWERHYASL